MNVNSLLVGFDTVIAALRMVLFAVGAGMAVVAGLSYATRTRRISPFGPLARFVRGRVDPLIAPVERRVVRAGAQPASAPWWALAAVLVAGIAIISVLGFVRQQIALAAYAAGAGPGGLVRLLVSWTFGVLQLALLVRVFSSWFRISPYSPWIRWTFGLTEWLLRPLRQVLPPFGMMDLSPIAAYFVLRILEWVVGGIIG